MSGVRPGVTPESHRSRHPALVQAPIVLVLLVVAAGLVRIVQYHWRQGAVLIGLALLLAAGLRAVLTADRAGLIAIRGRSVDVLSYGLFGLAVLAVALTIEDGPLAS